jgi:hypothetical protein
VRTPPHPDSIFLFFQRIFLRSSAIEGALKGLTDTPVVSRRVAGQACCLTQHMDRPVVILQRRYW